MELQSFVDRINSMTCAISVERKKDGGHGVIRIVTGNKAYIDSIEDPNHMSSSEMLNNKFIPNCEYTRYIPQDNNFEEICCTAALEGHPVHTYIHPERYSFWINVFVMPITSDDPDIGYCTYTQELTAAPDAELMTNVSADV
ncbi:MAG: GGDEF domain-containing protein, partial [Ruminococcus sp.]|nr:GGDEF domain-containing protein [Ruminococcus sp.]